LYVDFDVICWFTFFFPPKPFSHHQKWIHLVVFLSLHIMECHSTHFQLGRWKATK
jgi:hypothetical protein